MTEVRVPAEDNEDSNDEKESWLHHPYTQHLARVAKKEADEAHARMMSHALTSSDPRMVAFAFAFKNARDNHALLSGDWRRK